MEEPRIPEDEKSPEKRSGPDGPAITIDGERCIACYECVDVCPQSGHKEYPVYERSGDGPPHIANPGNCIACLSCEKACRALAIEIGVACHKEIAGLQEVRAREKNNSMF
ncbi:MAG: ferredoxin family protein [Actinomycetota bacterium]|nr:ferredoxin family protein [Actinomycetota bacterium]